MVRLLQHDDDVTQVWEVDVQHSNDFFRITIEVMWITPAQIGLSAARIAGDLHNVIG